MKDIGLTDSFGTPLIVGCKVKKTTQINKDVHGDFVVYEIKLQGMIPIMSYLYSQNGQVLPEGYTGSFVSDFYDREMLIFAKDPATLRPDVDDAFVVIE